MLLKMMLRLSSSQPSHIRLSRMLTRRIGPVGQGHLEVDLEEGGDQLERVPCSGSHRREALDPLAPDPAEEQVERSASQTSPSAKLRRITSGGRLVRG